MSRNRLFLLLLLLALAMPASCRRESDEPVEMSQATLAFTDAATDDLSLFEVDVTSVVFHKYSGATVSVLTKTSRVDFTALTDFGELVVGVGLEAGYYTGMTMTLDFSNASVYIVGETTAATLFDGDGNPLTGTMDVNIDFNPSDRPYVTAAKNHLFMLDLSLDQAISVNTSLNQVTFVPIISAVVDPTNPKPIIATGFLLSVDAGSSSFVVEKRAADASVIGSFRVIVDTATVYQLNGLGYEGAAGLTALEGMPVDTRVWVRGSVDPDTVALRATVVEAGAGTFGSGEDWVEGLIVGRDNVAGSDCTLTVLGRSKDVSTGTRTLNTSHAVTVSFANTKVLRRGVATAQDTDSLNVGQRILAFGTLSGLTLDCTGATSVTRMLRTSVFGYALGVPVNNTLTLNTMRIGLRHISNFNFSVGGSPEALPGTYTIDTTGLDTTGIVGGSRIRAIGRMNPVGIPTDDDFRAVSVVNRNADARLLLCGWVPATQTAISTATATALTLDISAAMWNVVDDGFAGQVTLTVSPAPEIQPKYAKGIYLIFENGGVQVHYDFTAFTVSLNARISPTAQVARVAALGSFNETTQVFSASVISVVLK
jgi:hypothetical protein